MVQAGDSMDDGAREEAPDHTSEPGDPEAAPAPEAAVPGEAELSGSPVAQAEAERDELRETVQRVQAEFENFRKRMVREQTERMERANQDLVEQILPVLDSFELAVLSIPAGDLDEASQKLRKGVELVYAELLGVLEKAGLERLDALGRPFDPNQHEAVMREGSGDRAVVTEVMRTGYRFKGRVLRPAMVKIEAVGGSVPDEVTDEAATEGSGDGPTSAAED